MQYLMGESVSGHESIGTPDGPIGQPSKSVKRRYKKRIRYKKRWDRKSWGRLSYVQKISLALIGIILIGVLLRVFFYFMFAVLEWVNAE
jgi:hypothetical protein